MDTGTIAAVAALVIALLALLIALAQVPLIALIWSYAAFAYSLQVLQQYFVTGQLIRICDSIVYGKMPGKGRRV